MTKYALKYYTQTSPRNTVYDKVCIEVLHPDITKEHCLRQSMYLRTTPRHHQGTLFTTKHALKYYTQTSPRNIVYHKACIEVLHPDITKEHCLLQSMYLSTTPRHHQGTLFTTKHVFKYYIQTSPRNTVYDKVCIEVLHPDITKEHCLLQSMYLSTTSRHHQGTLFMTKYALKYYIQTSPRNTVYYKACI